VGILIQQVVASFARRLLNRISTWEDDRSWLAGLLRRLAIAVKMPLFPWSDVAPGLRRDGYFSAVFVQFCRAALNAGGFYRISIGVPGEILAVILRAHASRQSVGG